jgi:signal transduction histidine kinase
MNALALLSAALAASTAFFAWRWWCASRALARLRAMAPREAPEQALEQAVARERERIHDDLHDDLGARLLQLVYAAPDAATADLARAALQDLRDVVSRARGASGGLHEVLADVRAEAAQRLSAAGIALRWEQADDLPELAFDRARALHLYRIVREAISNAIRHAQARALRVRVRLGADRLALELTDDGTGAEAGAADAAGQGMRSMRARAEQLHGAIRWAPGTEGGTKVLLTVPVQVPPSGPGA